MDANETLDQLTNAPRPVTIRGKVYLFSELDFDALGRLQAWIKRTVPHPLDAIKPHLDGLTPAERDKLIHEAKVEGRSWPPVVGTASAQGHLLGSTFGQVEVLREGLRIHHPDHTEADLRAVFRAINASEATAREVLGAIFGTFEDREDPEDPKGPEGRDGSIIG